MNVTQQPNINGFVAGTATAAATEACTSAATQGLKEITEKYTNQLSSISEQVEQFGEITKKLTEVSEKMLDFWNSSRFKDAGVYRAIEARGKADGSKETQRIFSEGFNGRKRSSDKTIMQIRNASHREILDRSRVHVVKEAIDGQIATVRIFQRSSDRNGGNAAGVVIFLLAEVYKVNIGVDNASSSRFQML